MENKDENRPEMLKKQDISLAWLLNKPVDFHLLSDNELKSLNLTFYYRFESQLKFLKRILTDFGHVFLNQQNRAIPENE